MGTSKEFIAHGLNTTGANTVIGNSATIKGTAVANIAVANIVSANAISLGNNIFANSTVISIPIGGVRIANTIGANNTILVSNTSGTFYESIPAYRTRKLISTLSFSESDTQAAANRAWAFTNLPTDFRDIFFEFDKLRPYATGGNYPRYRIEFSTDNGTTYPYWWNYNMTSYQRMTGRFYIKNYKSKVSVYTTNQIAYWGDDSNGYVNADQSDPVYITIGANAAINAVRFRLVDYNHYVISGSMSLWGF